MPFALLGLSLGLSAGIAPGPLLALLVQRTLSGGVRSGMRVALAPLLTDLPIVIVALLLVGQVSEKVLNWWLVVGGLFVIGLGISSWRETEEKVVTEPLTNARQDLIHAALVNFLNPHPYLFWAAVGAPTTIRAWRTAPWQAILFVICFYVMLISSKIGLAYIFSQARQLNQERLQMVARLSSLLLIVAGLVMLYSAWLGLRGV